MPTPVRKLWLDALLVKIQVLFNYAMFAVPSYVPEDLPACTLWDDTEDGVNEQYGEQTVDTTVNIEAHAEATDAGATVAEQQAALNAQGQEMLATLIKAATTDGSLGGLCDSITYVAGAVQYPGDGQDNISAGITIRVRWRHKTGDPYTAGA
jgi:hypothetical protein